MICRGWIKPAMTRYQKDSFRGSGQTTRRVASRLRPDARRLFREVLLQDPAAAVFDQFEDRRILPL